MNHSGPPWDGQCRCGRLTIRVTAAPLLSMACHCRGCQRMTASAYSLTLVVPREAFAVTAGEPVIGGMHGEPRHFFCGWCMSWVFTRAEALGELVMVRTAMLEAAADFPPYVEICVDEKLPWAETSAGRSYAAFPPQDAYPDLIVEYAALRGG